MGFMNARGVVWWVGSILLSWQSVVQAWSFPQGPDVERSTHHLVTRRQSWQTAGSALLGATALLSPRTALSVDPTPKDPFRVFMPLPGSLQGQTVVVTGATTGLGLESAKRLAAAGARVVLTARNPTKGQSAVQQVQDYCQLQGISDCTQRISYKVIDLDNLKAVQDSVKKGDWNDVERIDVLMNNAGVMALPHRELTVDGFERTIQSNHLGHFVLTALLTPKFSAKAKIINVSSEAHKLAATGLQFDSLWQGQSDRTPYGGWNAYGQSKLANILFTEELQRRIDQNPQLQWQTAVLHPGAVQTDLGRYLFGVEQYERLMRGEGGWLATAGSKFIARFLKTVPEGASTQVWLAAGAPGYVGPLHGQYFDDCHEVQLAKFAHDPVAAQRLWEESERFTGVKFFLPADRQS